MGDKVVGLIIMGIGLLVALALVGCQSSAESRCESQSCKEAVRLIESTWEAECDGGQSVSAKRRLDSFTDALVADILFGSAPYSDAAVVDDVIADHAARCQERRDSRLPYCDEEGVIWGDDCRQPETIGGS